jgi:VanZ family protein
MSSRNVPFRLFRRALSLVYLLSIFVFGVIELGPMPPGLPSDKLEHLLAFGGFVWVVELALLELGAARRRFVGVLVSCSSGLALELVQSALPHRSAEVMDFVADVAGALLAAALSVLLGRIVTERTKAEPRGT